MARTIELVKELPRSGQAYRSARDEALGEFAELLVVAGVIKEDFVDGVVTFSAVAP